MNLEDLYHKQYHTPSPMQEHCPTLRILAGSCRAVTELGVELATSTTALLAAQPDKLTCYDVFIRPEAEELRALAGRTIFRLIQADSLAVEIETCDLLFIDTKHTYEQLAAELSRHAGQVSRWIIMHDTVTFGEHGEDKGRGLLPAIREFLVAFPEWTIAGSYTNGHGLMVLEKR